MVVVQLRSLGKLETLGRLVRWVTFRALSGPLASTVNEDTAEVAARNCVGSTPAPEPPALQTGGHQVHEGPDPRDPPALPPRP